MSFKEWADNERVKRIPARRKRVEDWARTQPLGRTPQKRVTKEPEIKRMYGGLWGHMEADGTVYKAFILPVKDFELEDLGAIGDGYLVISGLKRHAYLLRKTGYLDANYIGEKFDLLPRDTENFIYLLAKMNPQWKYVGWTT